MINVNKYYFIYFVLNLYFYFFSIYFYTYFINQFNKFSTLLNI